MDQVKIGGFLKELRKEKELTQEQLAEKFNVSRRTVSRWENGSNLPDLDLLMEMSDFYEVELRELLDGERKSGKMDKELKETVLKVAEFSNEEKKKINKSMHVLFVIATILAVGGLALNFWEIQGPVWDFFAGFCQGVTSGMMVVGCVITGKNAAKLKRLFVK